MIFDPEFRLMAEFVRPVFEDRLTSALAKQESEWTILERRLMHAIRVSCWETGQDFATVLQRCKTEIERSRKGDH